MMPVLVSRPNLRLRSSLLRLLGLTALCSGTSIGASNHIVWLSVDPVGQTAWVDLESDLGYPVGLKRSVLTVPCKAGTIQTYPKPGTDGTLPAEIAKWKADPAVLQAVSQAGLVKTVSGVTTVKDTKDGQQLGLSCKDGVLSIDYSKMKAISFFPDPSSPYWRDPGNGELAFNLPVSVLGGTNLEALHLALRMVKYQGHWVFSRLIMQDSDAPAGLQVLVSDGKALYPLYFNGQTQKNSKVDDIILSDHADVYMTDAASKGSWRRTTITIKGPTLKTVPVAKPTLPIRQ